MEGSSKEGKGRRNGRKRKRIESDKTHARSEHVGLGEQEDRSDQDLARYIGESAEPLLSDIKKTDDHASLGDEDTEQNRPKAGALQAYELWMATFACNTGRGRRSDSNQDLAQHSLGKGGCDMAIDRLD